MSLAVLSRAACASMSTTTTTTTTRDRGDRYGPTEWAQLWMVQPDLGYFTCCVLVGGRTGYVSIYQMSYMWYGPFAVFVTTVTGLLVSFLTGIGYCQLYSL